MLKVIKNVRLSAIENLLRTSNYSPYLSRYYAKDNKSKGDLAVKTAITDNTFTKDNTNIPANAPKPSKTDSVGQVSETHKALMVAPSKSLEQFKTPTLATMPPAPCIKGKKKDNSKCFIEGLYGNPLNLPRAIVPPLQDTLTRLLRSSQPFVNDCDFYTTQKHCCNFEKQGGGKLNELLIKFANERQDWLEHLWMKYGYLLLRDPVTINRNPTVNFHKMDIDGVCAQMELAARLVVLALNYKRMAYQNKLPPEKSRCGQFEMESYKKIWGTARTIGDKIDKIDYCPKSRHIILVYKNNYFKVPVYSCEPDTSLSENDLMEQFNACMEQIREAVPVGILTADNRDCWHKNHLLLEKDRNSKVAIKEIREALFMVCIDEKMPGQKSKYDMVTQSHQLLHGGGFDVNTCNRWFDKTLQIIIGPTGMVGLNYEHTPVDGMNYIALADYLMQYSGKDCKLDIPDACTFPPPKRLEFCCSKQLLDAIDCSKRNVNNMIANYLQEVLEFKGYGKEFIKNAGLSTDSIIQIAIQYAFFKLHNQPAAQYETASTRIFNYGRTETIRSCCIEVLVFCKAMVCSDNIRLQSNLLRKAVQAHKCLSDEASRGLGVDRHFMALKAMSIEHKLPLPELYKDPGFIKSGYFRISSSNIQSRFKALTVYGPAVPDGYAICYNPREKDVIFGISSWKSARGGINATKYKEMIEKCMMELKKVIECGAPKPAEESGKKSKPAPSKPTPSKKK